MASVLSSSPAARVPIPPRGVDYRGKIVLAPMVRSGELPSRLLALKYGADLVWGPETVDKAMLHTTRRINERSSTVDFVRANTGHGNGHGQESVVYRIHPGLESRKLIFQIGTASPSTAVEAAKIVAGDVAGIDVNAGCPKPFSTIGGMGAALLKDPDRLCAILTALVQEVGREFEIGISVKIRILETAQETESLVRRLCATGITGLTVHCRTTPMRPRERAIRAQLRMIADVCRESGVACLMNGDVENHHQAWQLVEEYGVDGAMIATAAEKNSSCFRTEEEGGLLPWHDAVKEYLITAMDVHNRWGNTKFLLSQMVPGKSPMYKRCTANRSYSDAVKGLEYDNLVERARETDRVLRLGEFMEIVSKKSKRPVDEETTKPQKKQARESRREEREERMEVNVGAEGIALNA